MNFKLFAIATAVGASFITSNSAFPEERNFVKWHSESRVAEISCDGLATFTLDTNQRPTQSEHPSLCSCLIRKTNQKGWELDVLSKLNSGVDTSFIERSGAIARFGQAVDSCTAGKYYLSPPERDNNDEQEVDKLLTGSKQLLGFLAGGPIGLVLAPHAYDLFGGNLVVWIIAGAISGGFLWNIKGILTAALFSVVIRSRKSRK